MSVASPPAIEPIPAVDLSGGCVVRLLRGERGRETVYGRDPVAAAARFAAAGARRLHVVDLDAAFGDGGNRRAVGRLLRECPLAVQVAGGVRTVEDYQALRDAGAARVVFGTLAVESPEIVEAAIRRDPDGVAIALDVRGGRLQTRGWVEPAPGAEAPRMTPEAAARRWAERGAATLIHTGIERDGTMEGPDIASALRIAAASGLPVIVAGGVGNADHLRAVRERSAADPEASIAGVILGRALYEERLTLEDAFTALA